MKQIFIIFAIFLFASNTKAQSSIQPSSASVCTITIENGTSPKLTTENCISTDAEIIQKGTKNEKDYNLNYNGKWEYAFEHQVDC